MRTVIIGADHRGFEYKQQLATWLESQGYQVVDVGADHYDQADDYPDIARALGEAFAAARANDPLGILLCGSSVGVTVAANKVPGIRAAAGLTQAEVPHGRASDNMNVLTIGANLIDLETAKSLIGAFLETEFSGEERHVRRLAKIAALEKEFHADSN